MNGNHPPQRPIPRSKPKAEAYDVVIYGRRTRVVGSMRGAAAPEKRHDLMVEFLEKSGVNDYTVDADGVATNSDGHILAFERRE